MGAARRYVSGPRPRIGQLSAWHAEIRGRESMGSASSIFGNLGRLYAQDLYGRPKYLIREVNPVLPARSPDHLLGDGDRADDRRREQARDGDLRSVRPGGFILPVYALDPKPGLGLGY
jgi:hypothetical protein